MGKVIAITRGKYIVKLHSHAESSPLARLVTVPHPGRGDERPTSPGRSSRRARATDC